jgi:glycosyltransferase involved in cell wall biosynthesis
VPAPEVSVIVPAYRAARTLERCVESLLAQDHDRFEVIVVASADSDAELPRLDADPRIQVVTSVPRLSAAAARNRGVAAAQGPLLAFTDADVVVPSYWLRALLAASANGTKCVAGSVRNGTPESAAGTAEYMLEFLDLHPARPARTAWHGATCNLLVPREIWERYGPFPEDMVGGEDTLLTGLARADGAFVFAPGADVTHLNRTRVRDVLAHQYDFGRFSAQLGRRGPYKLRPLVRYTALAPVAAGGRVVSIYARVLGWMSGARKQAFAAAPVLIAALLAWGTGLLVEGIRLDRRSRAEGGRS